MAKRPIKTPRKKSGLPNIRRIVSASGVHRGKTVKRVTAGTILRIVGSGFGRRPDSVQVLFDDIVCKPFKLPFSEGELFVTAPLPPESTTTIRVQVGRKSSNRLRFHVERPKTRKGPTGLASRELFEAVDQLAGLTAAFARASTSLMDMDRTTRKTMLDAAEGLDRYRATGQRVVEMWMQWLPEQARQKFAPLRTIEFYDEAVQISGATDQVHGVTRTVFGNGGPVQQLIPGAPAALFTSAPPAAGTSSSDSSSASDRSWWLGWTGFWLHEATKAAEGVENFFKVLKP
ncbi:MAG: hypothetical protein HKM86_02910, partial [Deltaproteobacteria bacterium]|nr:hypothetical protein [Deltaproteobacteria bacterium]